MSPNKHEKLKILGIELDVVTISELNYYVSEIIKDNKREIIANHNLHSLYLLNDDDSLQKFWHKAYLTHIDGMPLIWWGKLLGYEIEKKHRITYLDWIHPLLEVANKNGWKLFYLGAKPGVANLASEKLSNKYPNISFKVHHGYFNTDPDSSDNSYILDLINSFQPNILMVGMGMPRQEKWIIEHFDDLQANVILNCGACFDYIAGEQKVPPRKIGRLGLEWLFRFLSDPKRLFSRYFIEPFKLLPIFVKDLRRKLN